MSDKQQSAVPRQNVLFPDRSIRTPISTTREGITSVNRGTESQTRETKPHQYQRGLVVADAVTAGHEDDWEMVEPSLLDDETFLKITGTTGQLAKDGALRDLLSELQDETPSAHTSCPPPAYEIYFHRIRFFLSQVTAIYRREVGLNVDLLAQHIIPSTKIVTTEDFLYIGHSLGVFVVSKADAKYHSVVGTIGGDQMALFTFCSRPSGAVSSIQDPVDAVRTLLVTTKIYCDDDVPGVTAEKLGSSTQRKDSCSRNYRLERIIVVVKDGKKIYFPRNENRPSAPTVEGLTNELSRFNFTTAFS